MMLEIQNFNKECPPTSLNYHYSVKCTCDALIVQFFAQQLIHWRYSPAISAAWYTFLSACELQNGTFFQLYFATTASAECHHVSSQFMMDGAAMFTWKQSFGQCRVFIPHIGFDVAEGKCIHVCYKIPNSPMSDTVQHVLNVCKMFQACSRGRLPAVFF